MTMVVELLYMKDEKITSIGISLTAAEIQALTIGFYYYFAVKDLLEDIMDKRSSKTLCYTVRPYVILAIHHTVSNFAKK